MVRKIKWYLYYKRILRLNKLEDKIKFLMTYQDKINFYSSNYRNSFINTIHRDIVNAIDELKAILKQPLETKFVAVRNITQDNLYYKSLSLWYSNDNFELPDNEIFIIWLEQILSFVNWYNIATQPNSNNAMMNNVRRLNPYYHDISTIVNTIVDNILKK